MSADSLARSRATGAFERRVERSLGRIAPRAAPVVVACSGGPDSSAALVAVVRAGWRVHAAHFDHSLRPAGEAEGDRAWVERLGALLGVPVLAGAAEGAGSDASEAVSREARYRWLARALAESGAVCCVTGHTLDDQAETVLLRLARGSGLAGAAGMAPVAPWPLADAANAADLVLARPLLGISRAEVERYLVALGLEARHDASNAELRYARNRVRLRILPEMERVHAGASRSLAQFAEFARRDDEALESVAAGEFARIASRRPGAVALERAAIAALPEAISARVLRRAVAELGLSASASQLDALRRAARRRGSRVDLAGGRGRSENAMLTIERSGRVARRPPQAGGRGRASGDA